jgi:hypothetical protein
MRRGGLRERDLGDQEAFRDQKSFCSALNLTSTLILSSFKVTPRFHPSPMNVCRRGFTNRE